MTVKELIKILTPLEQDAVVDIASDEEGNSYGDIDPQIAEAVLKDGGKTVYTLYPINSEDGEERYQ